MSHFARPRADFQAERAMRCSGCGIATRNISVAMQMQPVHTRLCYPCESKRAGPAAAGGKRPVWLGDDGGDVKHDGPKLSPRVPRKLDALKGEEVRIGQKPITEEFTPQQLNEFEEAFAQFDKNGDGRIISSELASVMHQLGETPSDKELQAMIQDVDRDASGSVEFGEFLHIMRELQKGHGGAKLNIWNNQGWRTYVENYEKLTTSPERAPVSARDRTKSVGFGSDVAQHMPAPPGNKRGSAFASRKSVVEATAKVGGRTPMLKYTYFPIAGRSVPIKVACKSANVSLELETVSYDEWFGPKAVGRNRQRFPYGNLPVLHVDGKPLAESLAHYQLIGQLTNMWPHDRFEQARANEILLGIEQAVSGTLEYDGDANFNSALQEANPQKRAALMRGPVTDRFGYYLGHVEDVAREHAKGKWILPGEDPTMVDVAAATWMGTFVSSGQFDPAIVQRFPNLMRVAANVHRDPRLGHHMDSCGALPIVGAVKTF